MPDRLAIMLDSVIFAVDKGLSFDGIVSMPEIGLEDFGRRPGLPGWVDYLTEQFWRAKAALSRRSRRRNPLPRVPTPPRPPPGSSSPPSPPPPPAPPLSSPSAPGPSPPSTTAPSPTPPSPTPSPSSPAPASPDAPLQRDPRMKHDPIPGDPLPRARGPIIEEQLPRRKNGRMPSGSDADQESRPDVGQNDDVASPVLIEQVSTGQGH